MPEPLRMNKARTVKSHIRRRVLHLLPNDIARGGQVIARDLRDALDTPAMEHRILTFFESGPALLDPDYSLHLPMRRLRHAGFDPMVTRRLRRAIDLLEPSIVVAHGGEPLKYAAPIMNGHTPFVYFSFGIATAPAQAGWRRAFYHWLMSRCDAVVGISDECVNEAASLFGVRADRLFMLPNSRDPGIFFPTGQPRDSRSDVSLFFVGHLTATKRPDFFVDVIAELRRRGHHVHAAIAGDGPLEAHIRARAKVAGIDVLGRRLDIPELLRRADIFLFTSKPESEGMPGVLIEAGLSGLPVVSTRTPGASTVICDGETGYVVDHDDFDSFVERTERLVTDRALRTSMGEAARQQCCERFSNEVVHAAWRRMLDSLGPQ